MRRSSDSLLSVEYKYSTEVLVRVPTRAAERNDCPGLKLETLKIFINRVI